MAKDFSAVTRRLDDVIKDAAGRVPAATASRANAESLRAQIVALEKGDYEPVLSSARDDVELDIFAPPQFPFVRRARGIDEYQQAVRQNFSNLEEQRPQISSVTADGDDIVVIGREQGRIRGTATAYDIQFVQRFKFREGKLASLQIIAANSV
jgi:ketosteroid isomerase-like protein